MFASICSYLKSGSGKCAVGKSVTSNESWKALRYSSRKNWSRTSMGVGVSFVMLSVICWAAPQRAPVSDPVEIVKGFYKALVPKDGDSGTPAKPDSLKELFLPELERLVTDLEQGPSLGDSLRQRGFRWFLRDVRIVEQEGDWCTAEATLVVTAPSDLWQLGIPTITQRFYLLRRIARWFIACPPSFSQPIRCFSMTDEDKQIILGFFKNYVEASSKWNEEAIWNLAAPVSRALLGREELMRVAHRNRIVRLLSKPEVVSKVKDYSQVVVRVPSAEIEDEKGARQVKEISVGLTPEGNEWRVIWMPELGPANLPTCP